VSCSAPPNLARIAAAPTASAGTRMRPAVYFLFLAFILSLVMALFRSVFAFCSASISASVIW